MSDVASPPVASCPECVHLRTLLEAALQRIAALEAEVRDLRGQLTRNSSNSSTPQGLRIFNVVCCKHFGQVVIIPTTAEPLGLEAGVGRLFLLQQTDGQPP
jgi:hypothetical protein